MDEDRGRMESGIVEGKREIKIECRVETAMII